MTLERMDNVLIVVDDLEAAKAFFVELGMELEGETTDIDVVVARTPTRAVRAVSLRPSPAASRECAAP